ncbi:protein DMP6-like [Cryptomeria japonica]|uniref:protein DMP6-like n=1 Tax=Cryptomeria japonica TaxID=3369 RepID=UPI0025ACB8C1|nr:protein DMP6-like [Cryptomeria japonica]
MKQSGANVKSNEESVIPISVNSTLSLASKIAKILPTGILFVFQALSNLLSNSQGCQTSDKYLVGVVVGILAIACFFFSLVDTFTDASTAIAVLVFCVKALTDQNVVHCLYPSEEANIQKIYQALLVALGALSGVIVVKIPSKRQGITSPVTTT